MTPVDSIKVDEMTLTFVCKGYPRKLVQHLREVHHFEVEAALQQGVLQGIDSFVLEYLEDGLEAESIVQ